MLKKTEEYGEQAGKLELEYDRLFTEDGLSKDAQIGGPGAVVQVGDMTVPKLNLSIIYTQQEEANEEESADEKEQKKKTVNSA